MRHSQACAIADEIEFLHDIECNVQSEDENDYHVLVNGWDVEMKIKQPIGDQDLLRIAQFYGE